MPLAPSRRITLLVLLYSGRRIGHEAFEATAFHFGSESFPSTLMAPD
jgi:hypothetical protein